MNMHIYFDFPFLLTSLVILSGLIALIDLLFFASKRKARGAKDPWIAEYAKSFFPVLLLVLLVRSFIIQPYRVPTGSLEPTVLPGDFIVVKQFSYGLRLPVLNTKIFGIGEPKRGDIALFRFPKDPSTLYVKRVIGLPGDHIEYKNKILFINGVVATQEKVGLDLDVEHSFAVPVERRSENLLGIKHQIFVNNEISAQDVVVTVPAGQYFMMGDNRDDSDDSRDWGFVPEANLVGPAFGVWMSWDAQENKVRWSRIGHALR
jgi:signal peptidase I